MNLFPSHDQGGYKIEGDIIKSSGFGADVNENNIPDALEVAKQVQKEKFDDEKLSIEKEKINQKAQVDREKLKIEKEKAKQTNSSK